MVFKRDKKGSIELSLNLIIMLIIGMVVLGLVIGFVNSLVNKGTESFDKQLGDNEKLKIEEVKTCPDNLCINPYPSITLKKGDKTNVFIKVRAFADEISCTAGDLNNCGVVSYDVVDEEGTSSDALLLTGPGFIANDGGDDSKMFTLKTQDTAIVGTYYLVMKIYPDSDNEETKTVTIEVE